MRRTIFLGMALAATGVPASAQRAITVDTPPAGRFDAAQVPPAPDYDGPANWASLPWIRDDGDMTAQGVAEGPQLRAPVDVFFIHSSVPLRRAVWNADTSDVWFNGDVGQTSIRNHASAFNGCCAIYAPRYRQANPAGDDPAARALAYSDVARAFAAFRTRVGDRPFILAGHGEGARIAQLLIERVIEGQPVAGRMVAAYLIGTPVTRDWLAARRGLAACSNATDTGCIVSWVSGLEGGTHRRAHGPVLCSNPIRWTSGPEIAPRATHRGAWMRNGAEFPEPPRAPDAGLVSARCDRDGVLRVSDPGGAYAELAGPDGSFAALDIPLFWLDLRDNAVARAAAFRAARR
jgi:pimeloyl-ACP methyl ester carboxylesterase